MAIDWSACSTSVQGRSGWAMLEKTVQQGI